jgi:hypothetical protein
MDHMHTPSRPNQYASIGTPTDPNRTHRTPLTRHRWLTGGFTAVVVAFGPLAIAACGGGGQSPSEANRADTPAGTTTDQATADDEAAPGTDVCELIAPSLLQATFGHPYNAGEATHLDEIDSDQCVWTNTDQDTANIFSLTIANGDDAVTRHDATREYTSAARDVAIGDDAFADGPAIWVRNGEHTYQFMAVGATEPATLHALAELAKKVVAG